MFKIIKVDGKNYTVGINSADDFIVKPEPSPTTREIIAGVVYQCIVSPKPPTYSVKSGKRRRGGVRG